MKFIKGITIIFGITMIGEFLNVLLPLPIPSGVYGLFLLLGALCLKAVKLEDVEEPGGFFLDTMPLMFIPAGVGLMNSWDVMESVLIPLTVITAASTIFVMAVTGKTAQRIIRKNRQEGQEE